MQKIREWARKHTLNDERNAASSRRICRFRHGTAAQMEVTGEGGITKYEAYR